MKIAAIDIGSNSVRLMLWADGKTLYKKLCTTRLGEGLSGAPRLKKEACERTANAVAQFAREAREKGAEKIYAFATAAVRSAENARYFLNLVKDKCGVEVDVVSGEKEARMGLAGALDSADGGIIDVGGASTEVTVRAGGKIIYSKSVNVGTVRILDAAGRNLRAIDNFVAGKVAEYGAADFSAYKFYGVGGTASRLAAVKHGLKVYDKDIIHGTVLTRDEVRGFAERLTALSPEEIRAATLLTNSADLIGGGAALLSAVMQNFNIPAVTVSESDNLEGYVLLRENEE